MDHIPNETLHQERVTVCDVQFRSGSKVYFFDPGQLKVSLGSDVIVDTAHGLEFGRCTRGNHTVCTSQVVSPLRQVIRIATSQDQRINEENRAHEKRAFDLCMKKIEELGLEMQLVSTEYTFDGSKVLFFFTADNRVDFRELVKILASILHTRIELRQIGVRDKAKMVGGLGICGRPFCCGEFLEEFQPVSIKMAKTQNLSLNPTKISGTCGRLMCCLNYEQEAYEDLLRTSPKAESFVDTPDGRGTVTNVNLLRQSVNVRLEKQPDTIVCHKNCDICVLRNGKAKKTDEPIPEDLAPISGGKEKKEQEQESPAFTTYLDPVVIRNSEESEQQPSSQAKSKHKRRRKGSKGTKPEQLPEKQELKPEKKEKKQEVKADKKEKKQEQKSDKKEKTKGGKALNKAEQKEKPKAEAAASEQESKEASDGAKQKSHSRKRRFYKHHRPSKKTE